nr:dihydrolipoyl dehydrogenase [Sedimentibacter sp.]
MDRDLIVIGGGPGGYVAAIRASQLGKKVTLVEEDKIGGTCLNRGCIPTKALYKNAEVINTLGHADDFGVSISDFSISMDKIQNRKNDVVNKLRSGIDQLLKGYGVEIIKGKAKLAGNKNVEIKDTDNFTKTITASNIIISTGSHSTPMNIPGIDLKGVLSSDEVLNIDNIPKSMVILGGGVVGVEFAGIFASFGTEITIIEFLPKLMYRLDEELSKRLTMYLKKKQIKVITGVSVKEVQSYDNGLKVITGNDKGTTEYICDNLLLAAGRSANVSDLNLESENIVYDKKGIKVNDNFETSAKGIFAVGDVIGGQMLAHVASEEGKVCVENIFGYNSYVNYNAVPSCVFSFPEVASVGMTEEEAKDKNINYIVGKSMFGANGKALTMNEGDGIIKVLARDDNHKIIGVHIIGAHASDIIHEGVLSIQNELTIERIIESTHAHPTLSETFYEACCCCVGEAIHALPRKK